ncbi:MAG: STAS domain-containing protein [Phycisphaerae bacterium]
MVTATNYGDVTVLTVKGELTTDTLGDFIEQRDGALAASRCKLVVDCAALEALDSAGLEALCGLRQACEQLAGTVKVCALDAVGRKVFEITRLDRKFELFDDLDSAVRSFA